MTVAFKQDIEAMFKTADRCSTLDELIPQLCAVLARNEDSLTDVTYRYRMRAIDTGYVCAFALEHGKFTMLTDADSVDVTVIGSQEHLLAVFKRKLNPMAALLRGKIKISGSKAALMKLAAFL